MAYNVRFLKGLSSAYTDLSVKDENSFYFTTDDSKLYLGTQELTNPKGLSEAITQVSQNKQDITKLKEEISTLVGGEGNESIHDMIDKAVKAALGDTSTLTTDAQDTIVAAINEVNEHADTAQTTAEAAQTAAQEAKTQSVVTVVKASKAEDGQFATYEVQQNGKKVGVSINVPQDVFLKSGAIVDKQGVKNLEITLNDTNQTKIDIPVGDLVDAYIAENAEDAKVEVTISPENKVSAALSDDAETSLGKADTALQPGDITEGTTAMAFSVKGTTVKVHGLGDLATKTLASLNLDQYAKTAELGDMASETKLTFIAELDKKYDAINAASTALTQAKGYTDTALTWGAITPVQD